MIQFECLECPAQFPTIPQLLTHMKEIHQKRPETKIAVIPFQRHDPKGEKTDE